MQKQSEIEERILGLIMGIGIGTVIGFLLRAAETRDDSHRKPAPRHASRSIIS
jgi:hypothetical protein